MAYTYPVAPVGAIFLTTFRMTFCGEQLINTYYHRVEANAGGLTINSLSDQMNTVFSAGGGLVATHNALREVACMLDRIDIQMIKPARYVQIPYVKTMPGTHTSTTGILDTPNLAAVITRRGEEANRRNVGSLHIPMPDPIGVATDGEITDATYKGHLGELATEMLNSLQDGMSTWKFDPVLWNFKRGVGSPRIPIVGTAVHPTVRVMRRRAVGRGL